MGRVLNVLDDPGDEGACGGAEGFGHKGDSGEESFECTEPLCIDKGLCGPKGSGSALLDDAEVVKDPEEDLEAFVSPVPRVERLDEDGDEGWCGEEAKVRVGAQDLVECLDGVLEDGAVVVEPLEGLEDHRDKTVLDELGVPPF